jgi:hypothetical protein
MYTRLDVVGAAESKAERLAFEDRLRYKKIMEAAEHFAAANGLVVAGASATRLLLGDAVAPQPIALDSFQYEFFSGRAPAQARALGKALHAADPDGLGHYVSVITKVPDFRLAVSVDGRDMFTVTALPAHRGVRTAEVLVPSRRPAQFASDANGRPLQLLCAGPDIQLMSVYGGLCDPAAAKDWEGLLVTEAGMRALFGPDMRRKIDRLAAAPATTGAAEQPQNAAARFRAAALERYVAGPGRVLIGSMAIALLGQESASAAAHGGPDGHKRPSKASRLQAVVTGGMAEETRAIAELAKRASADVSWTEHDPKIPGDTRLRRLTVYVATPNGREPVLDLYNAAGHELVPYTAAQVRGQTWKIGTPFVLMRFRLADMWTMQMLLRMGAVPPSYAKAALRDMLADYETAAAHYESALAVVARGGVDGPLAAEKLLPLTDYAGRLEDQELAMKRASQAGTRFYAPYMPAQDKSST